MSRDLGPDAPHVIGRTNGFAALSGRRRCGRLSHGWSFGTSEAILSRSREVGVGSIAGANEGRGAFGSPSSEEAFLVFGARLFHTRGVLSGYLALDGLWRGERPPAGRGERVEVKQAAKTLVQNWTRSQ